MILKKLSILNYKNILQAEVAFSPKMNCFFGNNGMGKTNLLDVIHYLSFCKSHINTPDSQIINNDQDLIRGGSDERRRFLDLIISQQDKQYLHALIQYNKALLQRNILLKNQNTDTSLYEVLEMQLDMYGRMVFEKRQLLVESFIPIFNEYYQTICRSTEQVGLGYISQLADRNLAESLAANRERDRILGYTSNGVHKDELEMTLNEQLIRRAGSQGQNKTYLIALKLAQFAFLTRKGQTTPILLLDDIFDKLDAARVAEIIKLVSGDSFGQIFITDTNRKYLDEILQAMNHDYALFRVEQGEVQPMEDQP